MWIHKPFFKYAFGAILVLIIIYLLGKIDYFVWPFQKLIAAVFFPILISGLLYYILRPVVGWISKALPKTASIVIVFAAIAGIACFSISTLGAMAGQQFMELTRKGPDKIEEISEETKQVIVEEKPDSISIGDIEAKAADFFKAISGKITQSLANVFSMITSIATVLVIVPFIVFYFLKDDHKLRPFLLKFIPEEHQQEGNRILKDIDKTLVTYVIGQFILALTDGILMFIGYKIIGLNNALLLALFTTIMTVVPFLGPLIGVIPALFTALLQEPFMAVKVLIVMAITQQLDSNLVTPHVMGSRLNLHPLTVIFLLLAAGSLYGFIGVIIAIPLYSVLKVIAKDIWKFYQLRSKRNASLQ